MKKMIIFLMVVTIGISINLLNTVNTAFAKEKFQDNRVMRDMTPEMRENAAKIHEEMAACLRSKKTLTECQKEMKASCIKTVGKNGCPMMHEMREMHEMNEGKNHNGKHEKMRMHDNTPVPEKK